MSDPPVSNKKAARTFDLESMFEQARSGAQERTKVDWSNEIEKTKEENEIRIAEMKLKADQAAKKMNASANNSNGDDDDVDDDDFGPSIDLATAPVADDGEASSDEEADNSQPQVKFQIGRSINNTRFSLSNFSRLIKAVIKLMMILIDHFFL